MKHNTYIKSYRYLNSPERKQSLVNLKVKQVSIQKSNVVAIRELAHVAKDFHKDLESIMNERTDESEASNYPYQLIPQTLLRTTAEGNEIEGCKASAVAAMMIK